VAARGALAQGTIAGKVETTPAQSIEETVVYLKQVPGTYQPQTHAMAQQNKTFVPHLLVVTAGDSVKFLNRDEVAHSVYSPDNEAYNLGSRKQNEDRTYTYSKTGVYTQRCSIHPEMLAFIFVAQNPYASAVDKRGHYTIKNVPPGSHTLAVWNSKLKGTDRSVTVAAGQTVTENIALK
jgi:plastocyanin